MTTPTCCHPIAALHRYRNHYELELACGHRARATYPGTQRWMDTLLRWKEQKLARFCATCYREGREGKP